MVAPQPKPLADGIAAVKNVLATFEHVRPLLLDDADEFSSVLEAIGMLDDSKLFGEASQQIDKLLTIQQDVAKRLLKELRNG